MLLLSKHKPSIQEVDWRNVIQTVMQNRFPKTGVTTENDPAWIDIMVAEARRCASHPAYEFQAYDYLDREIAAYEKQYGTLYLAE